MLDIQENHLPDPTVIRANSEIDPEEKLAIDAEEEEETTNTKNI